MKKELLLIIFLIVLLTGCSLVSKNPHREIQNKSFTGIIVEKSKDAIVIIDENQKIYTFSTEQCGKEYLDEANIGNKAQVTYKIINDINYVVKVNILNNEEENSLANGIFKDYYEIASQKLKTLTLEEKVGQLFLARAPKENQIEDIKRYHLGGYVLFARDFKNKSKDEVINMIQSYQNASSISMIIAVDEEGGTVNRISTNKKLRDEPFLSSQNLYNNGGFERIKEDTIEKSNLLRSLGINLNLAPVADISINKEDYIFNRSFGQDANLTSKYIETVIRASKETSVSYCLKHFPGYGNNIDTHNGISIDNRSFLTFETEDFLPFKAGIKDGAEAILVSHNITKVIENMPSSLSARIHEILRNELKFSGIIITDDLAMDAIKNYITTSPSVSALKAGNDMFIITDYKTGYNDILLAIQNNEIKEQDIDKAVLRILEWKYAKGLL